MSGCSTPTISSITHGDNLSGPAHWLLGMRRMKMWRANVFTYANNMRRNTRPPNHWLALISTHRHNFMHSKDCQSRCKLGDWYNKEVPKLSWPWSCTCAAVWILISIWNWKQCMPIKIYQFISLLLISPFPIVPKIVIWSSFLNYFVNGSVVLFFKL